MWPRVQMGPEMRRGIAELNGEGEVAGGIIIMRSGKNALETINAVKAKLEALSQACRLASRSCRPTIARVSSIARSRTCGDKLIEEFVVVALVCARVSAPPAFRLRGHRDRCRSACWWRSWSCTTRA